MKLQEGHPVDANLRPIKVGGETTALETANHGNGARVNGDLEVTGNIGGSMNHVKTQKISSDSITLNSEKGKFVVERQNVEFSVANSAFAGMILGYTTVGIDAATDSYTLSSTMTVLDDAMKVKFVAPPSLTVEISAQIYFDAARRAPRLGLSDANATTGYSAINFPNTDDVTNEHIQAFPPGSLGDSMLRPKWVVTGLTAGTAYEWWFAAATVLGTGGVLKWGGTATSEYPPFIMKATALPFATAEYATYG